MEGFDTNPGVLSMPHYKKYACFLLMFDLTSKQSFENIILCLKQIYENCPIEHHHCYLIGNKNDL